MINKEYGAKITKELLGIYLNKDIEAVQIPIETYKALKAKMYDYEMCIRDLEIQICKLEDKYFDKEYDLDIVEDLAGLQDIILDSGVR